MKITEKQIAELEKCNLDFLWKIRIFEMGLRQGESVEKNLRLHEEVKNTVKYIFNISNGAIMDQNIENMDKKYFAYELGRYIGEIRTAIASQIGELYYPLDAICDTYEEQVKKIFL